MAVQKIRNFSSCVEKHLLFAALSDHQYIPALKKKCYVPVWPCNVMFIIIYTVKTNDCRKYQINSL